MALTGCPLGQRLGSPRRSLTQGEVPATAGHRVSPDIANNATIPWIGRTSRHETTSGLGNEAQAVLARSLSSLGLVRPSAPYVVLDRSHEEVFLIRHAEAHSTIYGHHLF